MDTTTSETLLEGLKDSSDGVSWRRFNNRYRPMVVAFARKLGLSEEYADDAAQDTLLSFLQAYRAGKYEKEKGRLRAWLFAFAKNRIHDIHRKRDKAILLIDPSDAKAALAVIPSSDEMERIWEEEWRRAVFRSAMEEVAKRFDAVAMESFRLFMLERWRAEKVAEHLKIAPNTVYSHKRRVLKYLRKIEQQINELW